jgi:hypothetical protein
MLIRKKKKKKKQSQKNEPITISPPASPIPPLPFLQPIASSTSSSSSPLLTLPHIIGKKRKGDVEMEVAEGDSVDDGALGEVKPRVRGGDGGDVAGKGENAEDPGGWGWEGRRKRKRKGKGKRERERDQQIDR